MKRSLIKKDDVVVFTKLPDMRSGTIKVASTPHFNSRKLSVDYDNIDQNRWRVMQDPKPTGYLRLECIEDSAFTVNVWNTRYLVSNAYIESLNRKLTDIQASFLKAKAKFKKIPYLASI